MMAIKKPSVLICSGLMKKESMYSTMPLKTNKNGRDTLNPSLMGSLQLAKMSSAVDTMAKVLIIVTMLAQLVKSISIAILTTNKTPPIDRLNVFILVCF